MISVVVVPGGRWHECPARQADTPALGKRRSATPCPFSAAPPGVLPAALCAAATVPRASGSHDVGVAEARRVVRPCRRPSRSRRRPRRGRRRARHDVRVAQNLCNKRHVGARCRHSTTRTRTPGRTPPCAAPCGANRRRELASAPRRQAVCVLGEPCMHSSHLRGGVVKISRGRRRRRGIPRSGAFLKSSKNRDRRRRT